MTKLFFGWKVVAAAFTLAMFAWGVGFYGPSVFLRILTETHGWPVSAVAAAITAHFLLSALALTKLAAAHRRFGVPAVTRAGLVASALGVLGWAYAPTPAALFGATLLSGAGWAATSVPAIAAMVSPWFERRRAQALSHAFNGASVGGLLFAPLWVALIGHLGFRLAAALVALAMLAVLWPLVGRYLGTTPAALGLAPDGAASGSAAPAAEARSDPGLVRSRGFLTLAAAFALGLFAQIGLIALLVARLAPDLGDGPAGAALSLAAACAVAGRLALGPLANRDRRRLAAANFLMQAAGTALLALASGAAPLLAGCVLCGLGVGNLVTLPPLIAQREVSPADVGRVVALVTAVSQALFAFAPAAFGLLRDGTGSYAAPFLAAAGLQLAAAVMVLAGRGQPGGGHG